MVHVVPLFGVAQAEPAAEAGAHTEAQPDNPILPTVPELAWGAGTFLVLWVLMKFVLLKPIRATMEDRAERVRRDLEVAERLKAEAEAALAEHEASLASARVEASHIIDAARAEAEDERRGILAEAEAEVAQLRGQANEEIARAKAEALEQLRATVTTVAVQAAEIVVRKQLDATSYRGVVDDYVNRASRN